MSTRQAWAPSPLLSGIDRARRPTGPVLGIGVVLVCLLAGQVFGALVLVFLLGASPQRLVSGKLELPEQLLLTLSFLGTVVLLAAWLRWKERRTFLSVGFSRTRIGIPLLLGAVLGLAALTVPVLLNLLLGQFETTGSAARALPVGAVLLALVGFTVQASAEEITTRGYLMQTAYRKWGLAAAISLQAVVFAALHGLNVGISIVALVNLVLVALLLAFWALAEGSLWGVCAFHAMWNWCQGNVYGVEVSGMNVQTTLFDLGSAPGSSPLATGGAFGIEGSLITTAVLAAGALLAGIAFRRRSPG